MIVPRFDAEKEYRAFSEKTLLEYKMGNQILYDMCEKYPHHDDPDIVVSKMWLIGRSYAAAIERRKDKRPEDGAFGDDFYYNKVAPKIIRNRKHIDAAIDELKYASGDYKDNVKKVLKLHGRLVDLFEEITNLKKRSLAAKYLHFHCPKQVLIYDSRAKNAVCKVIHNPNIKWHSKAYDSQYTDFFARVIELTDAVEEKSGIRLTPRDVDNFLLHHIHDL